jgi:hypothetical protein
MVCVCVCGFVSGVVYFFERNKGSEVIEKQEENRTITPPQPLEIPDPYVSVSNVQENTAVFSFLIPIQSESIIPRNIRYCVLNMNAVPPTNQSCDEEVSAENGFTLSYNQSTRILTITGNATGNRGTGVFKTGCAACTSNIEFRNRRVLIYKIGKIGIKNFCRFLSLFFCYAEYGFFILLTVVRRVIPQNFHSVILINST